MPVRIRHLNGAGVVEPSDLFRGERPAERAEVLAKLFFVARADDDRGDRRFAREPVQRNLRNRLAGLLRDGVERVDDAVQEIVWNRWSDVRGSWKPADGRRAGGRAGVLRAA